MALPYGVAQIDITLTYSESIDTVSIYLGDFDLQVKFGDSGATLKITEDGTTCTGWLSDNGASSTDLNLSGIMNTYSGEFTLYIYNTSTVDATYIVEYTY